MAATIYAKNFTFTFDGIPVGKMMLDSVPDPSPEAEKVDDTTNDSGDYYEYFLGRIDSGDVTMRCLFDPDNAGQQAMIQAYADDVQAGALPHTCVLTLPGGVGSKSFQAYVATATTPLIDKKVGLEFKLIITGGTTWSSTATELTTPFFTVSGAGTVINPVASATPGTYVCNIAAGVSSVTITPTCATSGATIKVNGTTVASGAASSAITLGEAGTITNATIIVSKTGQAPGIYKLILSRAAS
jgi:hypothetical protein